MSKTTLFDSRIKKYAYREVTQLYGELGSAPAGLSPEQVERQREKYGSNCFGSRSSEVEVEGTLGYVANAGDCIAATDD